LQQPCRIPHAILCIVFLLFFYTDTYAQQDDFGVWARINIEKKFNKNNTLSINPEIRMYENATEVSNIYTDIGFSKKFNIFSAGISYRIGVKKKFDDTYNLRHRLMIDASYKYKLSKQIIASFRTRLQMQYADLHQQNAWRNPSLTFRHRYMLQYKPQKKITLAASTEFFHSITDQFQLSTIRWPITITYSINKKSEIGAGFMVQKELNKANPNRDFISLLNYTISL